MTTDVINFINKMKYVFERLSEDEIDTYNDMYNETATENFIIWINNKYEELSCK